MRLKHQFIKVNGINIHYVRQGHGKKLVVLLHGWPEFWYSWRYQLPELAKKFTVIAPDLRGFNLSDKPSRVACYQTKYVIQDIYELIKQLGFHQAFIVGHDWGGVVAWHFATCFPKLTEKLVILNCPHPKLMMKNLLANPRQLIKSWYMIAFQIPMIPELILSKTLKKFFQSNMQGWLFNKEHINGRDINLYVNAFKERDSLTASLNYYRAGFRYGVNRDLRNKKVEVPTRIIWGKNDKALTTGLNKKLDKVMNTRYEVIYLDSCSHWIQVDCPQAVNELLFTFFN